MKRDARSIEWYWKTLGRVIASVLVGCLRMLHMFLATVFSFLCFLADLLA